MILLTHEHNDGSNKPLHTMNLSKQTNDIKDYILDQLDDNIGLDNKASDLHHYLLNENYFIIGNAQAKEWLGNDWDEAISLIEGYDKFHFGSVYADLNDAEKVANYLAYIIGETMINDCLPVNSARNNDALINENTLDLIKLFIRNTEVKDSTNIWF